MAKRKPVQATITQTDVALGSKLENVGKDGYQSAVKIAGKDAVPAKEGTVVNIEALAGQAAQCIFNAYTGLYKGLGEVARQFLSAYGGGVPEEYTHAVTQFRRQTRIKLYQLYGVPKEVYEKEKKQRLPEQQKAIDRINSQMDYMTLILDSAKQNLSATQALVDSDKPVVEKIKALRQVRGVKTGAGRPAGTEDWIKRIQKARDLLQDMPSSFLPQMMMVFGTLIHSKTSDQEEKKLADLMLKHYKQVSTPAERLDKALTKAA